MTHEEYINSIQEFDGKLIDAAALAEYHYKLKKDVIENIENTIPHTIIITPDTYNTLDATVTITGFTSFPLNDNYGYYLIDNTGFAYTLQIDSNFNFSQEVNLNSEVTSFQVHLYDQDENELGVSNIAYVTRYQAIKASIFTANSTIENAFNASVAQTPRNSYKGEVNFVKPQSTTDPCTMWIFIPQQLDAPATIFGTNVAKFTKVNTYTRENVTYDVYKLVSNIASSVTSETLILQ